MAKRKAPATPEAPTAEAPAPQLPKDLQHELELCEAKLNGLHMEAQLINVRVPVLRTEQQAWTQRLQAAQAKAREIMQPTEKKEG